MAEASGEQHNTKYLEGGRQTHWERVAGTYAAAASPARRAGPPATAPRRWIHPGSTSVPSRSAAHRSTRPHSALHRDKMSPRIPGGQHRDGQLGASVLKEVMFNFGMLLSWYATPLLSTLTHGGWWPNPVAVLVSKETGGDGMGYFFFGKWFYSHNKISCLYLSVLSLAGSLLIFS